MAQDKIRKLEKVDPPAELKEYHQASIAAAKAIVRAIESKGLGGACQSIRAYGGARAAGPRFRWVWHPGGPGCQHS